MASQPHRIKQRLKYENCLGPLGGIVFSKKATEKMHFTNLPSCQDWDMYLDAIDHNSIIIYDWDIAFIKNDLHEDQISKDTKKKFLGVFRLARKHQLTIKDETLTRLSYAYKIHKSVKKHHALEAFYKKHQFKAWACHTVTTIKKRFA